MADGVAYLKYAFLYYFGQIGQLEIKGKINRDRLRETDTGRERQSDREN